MSKLDGEMLGHLNTVGQLHLLFSSLLLLSTYLTAGTNSG